MRESLPALRKGSRRAWIPILLLFARGFVPAEEVWYFSNAAGMTLERALSRFAALRNKYALSVAGREAAELPEYLREYHDPSFAIELHTLYEEGAESRRQWIFRDERGITRLVSSGDLAEIAGGDTAADPDLLSPDPEDAEPPPAEGEGDEDEDEAEPEGPSFFIEIYDENNLITEEHQFSGVETEYITRYFYNNTLLVRVETRIKEAAPVPDADAESEGEGEKIELLTTDYYRYSRSKSLRAVERIYHQTVPEEDRLVRLSFPHMILDAATDRNFVNPGTAYGSDFLQDVLTKTDGQVVYTTDERGRILVETTMDETGNVTGEIRNTWTGDRLTAVDWKSAGDERRSEYEYDQDGDRIRERNYRNGVLERLVRRENDRETEELYMNGVVVLRAVWQDGRKVSEEYFNPQGGGER
jgi:hypothetical protein